MKNHSKAENSHKVAVRDSKSCPKTGPNNMPTRLLIFLKPFILQQLFRRWPISPIHLHHFPDECLVLHDDFPLRRP